jgi:hypothetical protein
LNFSLQHQSINELPAIPSTRSTFDNNFKQPISDHQLQAQWVAVETPTARALLALVRQAAAPAA